MYPKLEDLTSLRQAIIIFCEWILHGIARFHEFLVALPGSIYLIYLLHAELKFIWKYRKLFEHCSFFFAYKNFVFTFFFHQIIHVQRWFYAKHGFFTISMLSFDKKFKPSIEFQAICVSIQQNGVGTQAYPYFMIGGRSFKRIVTPQKQEFSHSRQNVNSKAFTCLHVPPLGAVTLKLSLKIVFLRWNQAIYIVPHKYIWKTAFQLYLWDVFWYENNVFSPIPTYREIQTIM